ncbi:hypothetical protein [Actinomadura terrae]|uniref:hypothetical protein n=1 Tax=Actinomadura terrae TaxID=604353 RepID=UPI001FA71F33|nr:hypothetical protein [Actinomadura terrae]
MGRHEKTPGNHPQPPSEVEQEGGPATFIPQSERVTFLVHLAREFEDAAGLMTVFAVLDGFVVLRVVPVRAPRRARTVGCLYRHGQWWFYDVTADRTIRPANEISAAAKEIRTSMETAVAA